ncbi:MAG: PspC domain-containing protein [Oscillospiraceae bacterium]|nr:PspC domain-containing protein [Oscillospiraceae bacterium]
MKRLCRTEGPNAIICGVCGGIAHYFGVDPTVVRVATVLLMAFAGLSLWVYIIAALIMPRESTMC